MCHVKECGLYILGPVCPTYIRESKTIPLKFLAEPGDNINDNADSLSYLVFPHDSPTRSTLMFSALKIASFLNLAHCLEI